MIEPQWVGDCGGIEFKIPPPTDGRGVLRLKLTVAVQQPLESVPNPHLWVQIGVQNLDFREIYARAAIARLMDKLHAIEASDGTLLDHTVLVFGGSQTSSHSGSNFPMLLAGGNNLGFKHGQHVKWKGDERSASDLYLTILQQRGCPVKSFKESTRPLAELLA